MIKDLFLRLAFALKRVLQPLVRLGRSRGDTKVVEPYVGYATRRGLVLRGRVLARAPRKESSSQNRLSNLVNMAALFLTRELAGVTVRRGAQQTRSTEEGYFKLLLPSQTAPGWAEFDITLGDTEKTYICPAFVPHQDARFMVISDIDDTVLQTGATSLARNLWTTFTGSAATRHVYPDAVSLMSYLSEQERNPVYYVSSSPWNLHGFLENVLWSAGLVRGPMFLRDFGLSKTKFIADGHIHHKSQTIDALMDANPTLSAVLVGDTGQKDAEIYQAAVQRHPNRICAIVLRTAGNAGTAPTRRATDQENASDVPVFEGPNLQDHKAQLSDVLSALGP